MTLEIFRCEVCNKVLMETNHAPGSVIRMKCPRCETWNTLRVTPPIERPGGYEKRGVTWGGITDMLSSPIRTREE